MTNNKQQTAVEQLINHLIEYGFDLSLHKMEIEHFKEMHKEEIINSFFEGAYGGDNISGEQYYNETYGVNK